MTKVLVWEGGQKIVRDALPGDVRQDRSSTELDALADLVAAEMLDQDAKMKALGMVLADVVERAFGVSQATARQQVRDRFREYYRALLG